MANFLQNLPPEMLAEVFKHLPPYVAPNLKKTCREANDAFYFYNTPIRAAWIEKYLGLQTTYSTPNLHQLEDQAITKSIHEVIPGLILSVIGRMNVASLNLPLIRATKDDIHAVKQVLEASKSYNYLRSVYDGKILPLRLYRPVTNGLKGIEQVITRQMGLDAGWGHEDIRAIRENTICGGLYWVFRMLEGRATLDEHRHVFEPLEFDAPA